MFKKLKDKLAEEVKSSPQRIQQFAQAAQAAVTSASSSISDITNSDLFSIGDNDTQPNRLHKLSPVEPKSTFQEVSLVQQGSIQTSMDSIDFNSSQDMNESQRQRRLSNSSFASDVSFRLPSYESPSMYHLQSDMEISASEAEDRGFSGGNVSLDRVTKEQIYAAYRRTQQRYTKYRTQYADLARHYKLLERENAKARSVLVETQDKALRRISELREQCALEQSAKAHLEKALRIEIEEKSLKIDTLNTKVQLLQNNGLEREDTNENNAETKKDNGNNVHLISFDTGNNHNHDEVTPSEVINLNTKIEKLEKLVNKYKESLKATKEKTAQLTTETQILTGEIESKNKEIGELKTEAQKLSEVEEKLQEMNELNEDLQNKINMFDFNKNKELTTLELDLQKAQEEIMQLQSKIDVFHKREEEYAISLAENKLSIHKELESKESEIKSLKDLLSQSKNEVQSLNIVLNDYKNKASTLENECAKLRNDSNELNSMKSKITELETQILEVTEKCQALETTKSKAFEEYKCLQLQLKQETAEKLAMIDRNVYLENRNTQLSDENTKKTTQINALDIELQNIKKEKETSSDQETTEKEEMRKEILKWKHKCSTLESEIQEEREELVKLQTEIEKLLANDDLIQIQNSELNALVNTLKSENDFLKEKLLNVRNMKAGSEILLLQTQDLRKIMSLTCQDIKSHKEICASEIIKLKTNIETLMAKQILNEELSQSDRNIELKRLSEEYESILKEVNTLTEENFRLKSEISDKERKINELDQKIDRLNKENENTFNELISSQKAKTELSTELEQLQAKCEEFNNMIDRNNDENKALKDEVTYLTEKINKFQSDAVLQEDNEKTELKLEQYKAKYQELQNIVDSNSRIQENHKQEIYELTEKFDNLKCDYALTQKEKEHLEQELRNKMSKCKELQHIINTINNEHKDMNQNITKLREELDNTKTKCQELQFAVDHDKEEKEMLKAEISEHENKNSLKNTEIAQLNKSYAENIQQLSQSKQENEILVQKLRQTENSVKKLQRHITELTQENISIKTQSEEIACNIKDLEIELSEVRQSHLDIENEKDHLNTVIEQLEKRENEKEFDYKYTQTSEKIDNAVETSVIKEMCELSTQNKLIDNDSQSSIIDQNYSLKEENKRLQSDIAGLQTYLAQISKENSILNDKLRELIASSENSSENQNDHRSENEKLEELIRENRELVEENLELKDQINSQHYATQTEPSRNHDNVKDSELLNLKEKYTSIMDINSKLEQRLLELEQMNKSFNINMSQVQGHNEKLRLTNEKLERRLDEALVSLRHLHSLQENTELEYLRNILYEYLTGTGAHSVTLAKVLAAVVKFDKAQTDLILQKEKERQGLLRQLGLL